MSGEFQPRRFEVVVGAILTQNINWNNVESAIQNMIRKRLVDSDSIRRCSRPELEKAIHSAGFYRQKAERLQTVAQFIFGYPEDFYHHVRREQLLSIKGIGPETADSILLYACDQPHFVIDAYTRRIFARYGLLDEKASYELTKNFFESNLPVDVSLYKRFHALIVEHGKHTCRKMPLCEGCAFQIDCHSATFF
ncbi:hypothetical protein MYX82_08225, partial [Acidobacteria bacterium AH-259-D05]|nr:hypothetical protein [Acidobacteria bacterium AH-259-D05]